jgi:hypothetical protein
MVVARVQGTSIAWREWVETGEGSDLCLTQFLVSTDASGAPFTSIQAAYTAAVNAGHDATNPAVILVCPGTYTEPVTMDTPGIDIVAVGQDSQEAQLIGARGDGATVLVGLLTIDLAPAAGGRDATTARWQGIDIKPAIGAGIILSGPNNAALYFYLADCQVVSPDDGGILISNTGVDGFLATVLDIQNCRIESQRVPGGAAVIGSGIGPFPISTLVAESSSFIGTDNCFVMSDEAIRLDSCVLVSAGPCVVMGDAVLICRDTFIETDDVNAIVGDSTIELVDCKIRVELPGPAIVSGGVLFHDNITFLGGTATVPEGWLSGAAAVFQHQAVPQESHNVLQTGGGGLFITTQSNVVVESPVGGDVIFLPPASERAGALRLKLGENNLGTVFVLAQGGDDIRLGGSAPVPGFPLTDDGVFLVSTDPTRWEGWEFGSETCLNTFLVSPDANLAPYQTIQDAYDAAVAAGANSINPAKVLVCPGEYTEDVTMSQAGIDIVACAPDDYNELRTGTVSGGPFGVTRLIGTVTIDIGGTGATDPLTTCAWRGIDISASSVNGAIHFIGDQYQYAFVSDCAIVNDTEAAVELVNTGTSAVDDSTLDIIRCGLENTEVASASAFDVVDGRLILSDCVCSGNNPNTIAAGALASITGSRILNQTSVAGTLVAAYSTLQDVTFSAATGILDVTQCELPTGPIAGGAGPGFGRFVYDSLPTPSTSFTSLDPAADNQQKSSIPPAGAVRPFAGAGPHVLDGGESNVVVDTPVAGATMTLPTITAASARIGPIRIKNRVGSAGSLTVAPAGGNTLNEAGVGIVLGAGASLTVVGWQASLDWETYD